MLEMESLQKSISESPDVKNKNLLKKKIRETGIRYSITMEKRMRR
ncbi:hypothetical protein Dtox_2634 [Desulfofarcimen acetoxidans DSM 771]|uniref:Uncharacterized protein n=1 Tax=Desulfofarcimen acetoxidans (strain ATCC 49208 / DSM 771 / KCTC 5769 / VKM B-1644 / 5575) TaxID=485916 RepID=C8W127_DESAS|nr:hypothetical protein [Desulfofarcimen acetoxidans]ACV63423.1 hypothetical protein Dtox_2634 [Desulfofarcimen acetoxidans DSM 771]